MKASIVVLFAAAALALAASALSRHRSPRSRSASAAGPVVLRRREAPWTKSNGVVAVDISDRTGINGLSEALRGRHRRQHFHRHHGGQRRARALARDRSAHFPRGHAWRRRGPLRLGSARQLDDQRGRHRYGRSAQRAHAALEILRQSRRGYGRRGRRRHHAADGHRRAHTRAIDRCSCRAPPCLRSPPRNPAAARMPSRSSPRRTASSRPCSRPVAARGRGFGRASNSPQCRGGAP